MHGRSDIRANRRTRKVESFQNSTVFSLSLPTPNPPFPSFMFSLHLTHFFSWQIHRRFFFVMQCSDVGWKCKMARFYHEQRMTETLLERKVDAKLQFEPNSIQAQKDKASLNWFQQTIGWKAKHWKDISVSCLSLHSKMEIFCRRQRDLWRHCKTIC